LRGMARGKLTKRKRMGLLLFEVHYTILQTTQLRSHQAIHTEASKTLIWERT